MHMSTALCNYSHCQKAEAKDPHCRFNIEVEKWATSTITLSYTEPYNHTHLQVVMELLNQRGFSSSSGLLAIGISEILNTDRLLFMKPFIFISPCG